MCGILAYLGKKSGTKYFINGLTLLEYRGYDSVGIGFFQNQKSKLYKLPGSVSKFKQNFGSQFENLEIFSGLGHTRWATHGAPTSINAHPHISYSNRLMIVHNGIVENYLELKEILLKNDIKQLSQTDTEIFVNYLDFSLQHDNLNDLNSLSDVLKNIKGSFAVVMLDKLNPEKMFFFRKKSPLIIGKDIDENIYCASDMNAFDESVNKICVIPDNSIICAYKNGLIEAIDIFSQKKISIQFQDFISSNYTLNLDGYQHFMLKEIEEQPFILKALLKEYYNFKEKKIIDILFKQETLNRFKKVKKICLIGCGTSFHSAKFGEYVFEQINELSVFSESGGEFKYRKINADKNTLFIFLSQSGETADLIGPLEIVKQKGGYTLAICNVINSTLSQLADDVCYMKAGPEISVASTKAFTAQLLLLILVAQKIAQCQSQSLENFETFANDMNEIEDITSHLLNQKDQYQIIAQQQILTKKVILFIGRNINFPIALEGALKLKEISYKNCDGMQMGELKHGPLALIDNHSVTLACEGREDMYDKYISNIREILSRNGMVISIVPENFETIKEKNLIEIKYLTKHSFVNSICSVMIFQLLSYFAALSLGVDIDKPRNLAKSVTVE